MDVLKFYVTFGVRYGTDPERHDIHPVGMTGKGFACIQAPDEETARKMAFAAFGDKFAFIYSEEEFKITAERFPFEDGMLLLIPWITREEINRILMSRVEQLLGRL